jgi:hypothetical protein
MLRRMARRLASVVLVFGIAAAACSSKSSSNGDSGVAGDAGSGDVAASVDRAGDVAVDMAGNSVTGATVTGTLMLPGTATGKQYQVRVVTGLGAATLTPVAVATGTTTGSTTLTYSIPDVPAGTYYILAFVDVNGTSGTSSTPGDYAGWYGENAYGNPPAAPNAKVPASGTVTFDFGLVLR